MSNESRKNRQHQANYELKPLRIAVAGVCASMAFSGAQAADLCTTAATTISGSPNVGFCDLDAGAALLVDPLAALTNTSAPAAAFVSGGVAAGSITNSGTISSTTQGLVVFTGASLTGAITNNTGGIIQAVNTNSSGSSVTASGLVLFTTGSVAGGISNSGSILGTAESAISNQTGTSLATNQIMASAHGLRSNMGVITGDLANNSGAVIAAEAVTGFSNLDLSSSAGNLSNTASAYGLRSTGSVSGDVANSGTITATATNTNQDIMIDSSSSGIRLASMSALAYAVDQGGTVGGDLINSGTIDPALGTVSGGTISAMATNTIDNLNFDSTASSAFINYLYATAAGIYNHGTVSGSILNSGSVMASASNSVLNSGLIAGSSAYINTMSVEAYGLYNSSPIGGDISNSGLITATAKNLVDTVTLDGDTGSAYISKQRASASGLYNSSAIAGDLLNSSSGTISAAAINEILNTTVIGGNGYSKDAYISSQSGSAYGIQNRGAITGELSNSGSVSASVANTISNSTITSNGTSYSALAYVKSQQGTAYGLYNKGGTIGDALNNSGSITASVTNTIEAVSVTYNASSSYSAYIDSQNARAYGIYNDSTVGAGLSNSGSIVSTASNTLNDVSVINNGSGSAYISKQTATGYGIYNSGGNITGSLDNSGSISATASNSLSAITIDASSGTARISAEYAYAYGIYNKNGDITQDLSNSGSITVNATNSADDLMLSGKSKANLYAQSVSAYGIYNSGNITGAFANSGTINVTALNEVLESDLTARQTYVYEQNAAEVYGIYNSGNVGTDLSNSSSDSIVVTSRNVIENSTFNATNSTAYISNQTAYGYGVYNSGAIGGYISNSGSIGVEAENDILMTTLDGDSAYISRQSAYAYGIYNDSSVVGSITNSGSINTKAANTQTDTSLTANDTNDGVAYVSKLKGTAYGIYNKSTVSADLVNSGTIMATSSNTINNGSIAAEGIVATQNKSNAYLYSLNARAYGIRNSNTVAGDINNSGSIAAQAINDLNVDINSADEDAYIYYAQADAYGIRQSSTLGGDITNTSSDTIVATATNILTDSDITGNGDAFIGSSTTGLSATAYGIYSSGTFTGAIDNSGAITAGAANILTDVSLTAASGDAYIAFQNADGYGIRNSAAITSLISSGDIVSLASNTNIDVSLSASQGSAYLYTSAQAYGIYNSGGGTLSELTNSGTVLTSAAGALVNVNFTGTSSVYAYGTLSAYGIYNSSAVSGDLTNSGNIFAGAGAIYDNVNLMGGSSGVASVQANITAYGIHNSGAITGDMLNSGSVIATAISVVDDVLVMNDATASKVYNYQSQAAYGIQLTNSVGGDLENSGSVLAGGVGAVNPGGGIVVDNLIGGAIADTLASFNNVTVSNLGGSSAYLYNSGMAIGLQFSGGVGGDLLNSGNIVANSEVKLEAVTVNSPSTSGNAFIEIDQSARAVDQQSNITGNLDNSGTIRAGATVLTTDVNVSASSQVSLTVSAYAYGIYNNSYSIGGTSGINNSGIISAYSKVDTSGVVLAGGVSTATQFSVQAVGLYLGGGATVAGNITNTGSISGKWDGGNAATSSANFYGAGIHIETGSNIAGVMVGGTLTQLNNSGSIKGTDDGLAINDIGGGTFNILNNGTIYGDNAISTTNGTVNIDGTGFLTGDLNGGTTTTLNIVGDQTVDGDITDFASPVTVKATTGALRTFDTTVNTDVTFEMDTLFSGTLNADPTVSNFNVTGAVTTDASLTLVVDASNGTVLEEGNTHIIINNDSDTTGDMSAIVVPTADVQDNNIGFNFDASLDANGNLQVTVASETATDIVIPDGEVQYANQDFSFNSVTVGDAGGAASGTLVQQDGTLDVPDGIVANDGGKFTQTDTGVLNTPTITIGDGGVVTLKNQNTEGTIAIDGAAEGEGELVFTGDWNTDAAIGGTNSLAKVTVGGSGNLTLDENLDATTIFVQGILNQTAGTLTAGSNTLIVAAGASFTQSADGVLNSPTIVIGDMGTVTLVNQNTEGTVAIDGANPGEGLLVFAGDWDLDAAIGATASLDTVTVNSGVSLTIDQPVSTTNLTIAGAVTKASADNLNANTTIADGGAMLVNTSFTHNGNLTVGGGTSGSLDAGGNTVNVTGDFALNAGSTFNTTINSTAADDAGRVVATGNATVSADATIDVSVPDLTGIQDGNTYKIIDGAGGTGVAVPTTINDDSTRLSFAGSTDGSDLTLTAQIGSIAGFVDGLNPNATAVVNVVDDVVPNDPDLLAALLVVPDNEFQDAIESLAPDMSSAVLSVTNTASRMAIGTVLGRLSDLRVSQGSNTAVSGMAAGDPTDGMAAWFQGFTTSSDQDDRQGIDGYDADTQGFLLGLDSMVRDNLRLGIAFSYASTDVDTNNSGNSTDIDSYQGTLYGSFENGPHIFDASLSYAGNEYDGRRLINVGPLQRVARADYDAGQFTLQGNYSRHFDMGDGVTLAPTLGFYYVNLDVDGFDETGAGATNLSVEGESYNTFESVVGASLYKTIKTDAGYYLTPEVHVNWRHDFIGDEQTNTSTFTGGGASFTTRGFDPVKDSFNVGGSLTLFSTSNLEFRAAYDFEAKSTFSGHSGTVTVRYRF